MKYHARLALLLALTAGPAFAQAPSPAQTKALTGLADRYVAAWNVADPDALASAYTTDGDFITPDGTRSQGHRAIHDFYAAVFASGFAGSHSGFAMKGVRLVTPTVAVLDGTWFIEGARTKAGAARPREQGIASMVAIRTATGWRIAALREQESATSIQP